MEEGVGIEETRSLDRVIEIAADHPSLKAALLDVAAMDDGQTISNVRLARWLRNFDEVPVGGLQLSGGGVEDGSPLWRLQAVGDGGGIAFLITKKMRAQLRDEHGLSDEQIFNLKPQQAHFILAKGGRPVTKSGTTFIVLGPAGADATCLYCHSAKPDTTGGVVHTDYGTLHEECAPAWITR
jgi:hypothetical protein